MRAERGLLLVAVGAVLGGAAEGKGGWGSRGSSGGRGGGFSLYGRKSSSSLSGIRRTPRMNAFIMGAGVGYLAGRSHSYYYTPYGFNSGYGTYGRSRYWSREQNMCSAKVEKSELRQANASAKWEDNEPYVTVYFLCDGRCCGKDCCELNSGFIAFLVIAALVGVCGCAACCYKLNRDESGSAARWSQSLRRDPAAATRGAGEARNTASFTPVAKDERVPYPAAPQPPAAAFDPYGIGGAAASSAEPPSYHQATSPSYNPYSGGATNANIGFKP